MGCKLVQNFLEENFLEDLNLGVSIKFKMFVQFDPTIIFLGLLEILTHMYKDNT